MEQADNLILLDNLNWCLKNNYNISLSNKEKYSKAVYYLMNSKDKIGFWTESEIKLMIVFFAYDFASKFKIENKVKLEFLSLSSDTMAACHDNLDGTYLVQISHKVIEGFLKGKEAPLDSIQTVFHEMVHVIQNELVKGNFLQKEDNYYSSKTYIMVLEVLARKVDKSFYNINYSKLFKENHANKVGLQFALAYLKKYGPTFYSTYNKDIMLLRMKYYDKMMNNSKIVIYDKEQDIFKGLDTLTFFYIQNNKEVLEKYPILKLAYNSDGSKKNILQLLEDREKLLSKEEEKIVNELYEILANRKNFMLDKKNSTRKEIELLISYINKIEKEDNFVYDLLLYRLKRSKFSEESIKTILNILKSNNSNELLKNNNVKQVNFN